MWQSPCGTGSLQGKEVCGIIKSQEAHQKVAGATLPEKKEVELSSSVRKIKILRQLHSGSECALLPYTGQPPWNHLVNQ